MLAKSMVETIVDFYRRASTPQPIALAFPIDTMYCGAEQCVTVACFTFLHFDALGKGVNFRGVMIKRVARRMAVSTEN